LGGWPFIDLRGGNYPKLIWVPKKGEWSSVKQPEVGGLSIPPPLEKPTIAHRKRVESRMKRTLGGYFFTFPHFVPKKTPCEPATAGVVGPAHMLVYPPQASSPLLIYRSKPADVRAP